jgi:hypothetical protein
MSSRKPRKASPEENKIINSHLAGILEDLNNAGIYCDGVLAFVTLEDSNYNLSTMMAATIAEEVETASEALIQYAHDELCDHLERVEGIEHRVAPTPVGRVEGIVMENAVTESMGWRQRLESVRRIPHDGAERISISVKMLEDVKMALEHLAKLEASIRECEGDGGCRATKVVQEEKERRPLN